MYPVLLGSAVMFSIKSVRRRTSPVPFCPRRADRRNPLAFYDALEVNDSAVKVLGDEALRTIARELVDTVRKNVTIDWTVRESVRARLCVIVKRILRKYGYPPDKQESATNTALQQAELLSDVWADAGV